jgi:hypothetical protein
MDMSCKFVVPISSSITIMTVAYETGSTGTISIIKNGATAPAAYTTSAIFTNPSTGGTTTPITIPTPIQVAAGDTIQVRSNGAHFDRTCVVLYFG